MNNKVVILSGGTGGHVIPAVNFGNFLLENSFDCKLLIDHRGLRYSNSFNGNTKIIYSAHFSGNIWFKLKSISLLLLGFFQSMFLILRYRPRNCISFGSYATFMTLLVILLFRVFFKINIYIHEQNSVIGKVNSLYLPFAKNFFTNYNQLKNFNKKYNFKLIHVGLPRNKKSFNFNKVNKKITIFIYGGSQGSIPLINKSLAMIKNLDITIINEICLIVQAQKYMHSSIIDQLKGLNIEFEIKEFYSNIYEKLSSSDLAITRAGAGTINDLISFNLPSIIMPLPHSISNHQYYNARYLSDKNAAILIDEHNFDTEINSNILKHLIIDKNIRKNLKNELSKIYVPNANAKMLLKIRNENN